VLALSGLGVYVGRYERWNSWEVLTEPTKIVAGLGAGLLDPLAVVPRHVVDAMKRQ
jgi:uncharacterized membrane protein